MPDKKHALLLFAKAPLPGVVKTRLTEARGGIFTPEEAADFFKHCLLDMAEISFAALADLSAAAAAETDGAQRRYDLFVSTSPAEHQPHLEKVFDEGGPWPAPINYMIDSGKTFDEHFDDAFAQLFAAGYSSVVAVGGDLPQMPPSHIVSAFQWLDYFSSYSEVGGFVQAPCQECGVSLIGYTDTTPMDSTGVYYNLMGRAALDGYIAKAAEKNIPVACLGPVADIDDTTDLAHAASLIRALGYAGAHQPALHVPRHTLWWLDVHGVVISTPPNSEHDPREMQDR
ncbi:MAG: DUF2064 domain-containing protein [Coriobacteriia bacterium]|nr:DUF2064 domain-containing protein [Coriobacteriia bacterium]